MSSHPAISDLLMFWRYKFLSRLAHAGERQTAGSTGPNRQPAKPAPEVRQHPQQLPNPFSPGIFITDLELSRCALLRKKVRILTEPATISSEC
jgi:hypothetical protein